MYRAAAGVKADPVALFDSRNCLETIKEVDPADPKAITDAIETAVKTNPKLHATPAAGASALDFGGTGETKQPLSLNAAVAKHYGG